MNTLPMHVTPPTFCAGIDAGNVAGCVLWLGMSWIAVTTTLRLAANSASNFQILLGTDNVMVWWFVILVPVSFTILAARAVENMIEDLRRFRENAPLIEMTTLGDT